MSQLLKTIILGGGGHGRDVFGLLSRQQNLSIIAILDDNWKDKERFLGCPALLLEGIQKHLDSGDHYALGIGYPLIRRRILDSIADCELTPIPTATHPSSVVSEHAKLGIGCTIFELSSVSPNVNIGDHCSISQHVTIGHDTVLEENVCVFPGASISGNVRVGKDTMIGTNATILQHVSIGENVKIGAGSLIIKDVPDGATMTAAPAQLRQ